MANELGVYQLFKNILSASMVIEGRFVILNRIAADMNSSNFGEDVNDALGGLTTSKKYPAVVMTPPIETSINDDKGMYTMRFDMYFLTKYGITGDGDVKSKDLETNRSLHTKEQDWKDMREVAANFRRKLRELIRRPPVCNEIREVKDSRDEYYRITYKMNDNVNGIKLCFELQLVDDCNALADYDNDVEIEIPDLSPHPLHKH